MTEPNAIWEALGAVRAELADARLQLHYAAQVPAAAGIALAEPSPDFAHHSLSWNQDTRSWVSPAFDDGERVALRPEDLTLHFLDPSGAARDELLLHGKRLEDGLRWVDQCRRDAHDGRSSGPLELPTHELPDHAVAGGEPFRLVPIAAFGELARWYANAERELHALHASTVGASPVRTWAHHFDIAINVPLDANPDPEAAKSYGVGMSPGDGSYAEPYWYVLPWPAPAPSKLGALEGGAWHTEGWVGAVLTSSEVVRVPDPERQRTAVRAFLRSGIERTCEALGVAAG